ncbi:hypothetical protein SH501x_000879 [Pirellulaceae bacterium SH501]
MSAQEIGQASSKESTLLLDTVAYQYPHGTVIPPVKFEVKAGVTEMRRSAAFADPFTLASCSVAAVRTKKAKSAFLLDYKVLEEFENTEGHFEAWLLFGENLSGARLIFSKEAPWAPELMEFRFNPDRSPAQVRKIVSIDDLKSWKVVRRTSSKWGEVQPGQFAPILVRQDADDAGGKTTTEYRFKNYKKITKEDRELLKEENFTSANIVDRVNFLSIFESFEAGNTEKN